MIHKNSLLFLLFIGIQSQTMNKIAIRMPDVKPQKIDTHLCTALRVDPTQEFYITSYEPFASMETVHHMFIQGCNEPGSDEEVWNCRNDVPQQPGLEFAPICKKRNSMTLIYLWARNATKVVLPKDVGFAVGGKTGLHYIVLQVHYASVERFKKDEPFTDSSGITLSYTSTPMPKIAAIYFVTTLGRILPNTTEYFEAACKIKEDVVMHPFAFRVHTHGLGLVVSGYKVTKTKAYLEDWQLIGKKDPQLPQMFYPIENEMTIRKGDVLATRCTMYNYRNKTVRHGNTNNDEMCSFYIMFWTEKKALQAKYCVSFGPPAQYWYRSGLQAYPDAAASTLPVGESAKEQGYFGVPL